MAKRELESAKSRPKMREEGEVPYQLHNLTILGQYQVPQPGLDDDLRKSWGVRRYATQEPYFWVCSSIGRADALQA